MQRRSFLSLSAAAGAALAAPARLPAESSENTQDGETFWALLREQFTLAPEAIYLNNGTMGPSPAVVQEVTTARMAYTDASGDYGGAEKEELRAAAARLLHAAPEEIALTHNTTESICIVAAGLRLRAGDEVILSTHEHAGNAVPWLARHQRDGVRIRVIAAGGSREATLAAIERTITDRTRVIALPHVSCTIGQVFPAQEIAALARRRGIFFLVDGAHPVGMMPVDVRAIDCDAYAACGHKWLLGPKGTGFLYLRKDRLDEVDPVWCGGESDGGWNLAAESLAWLPTASRYDFATQNNALYLGLTRAVAFFESVGPERVGARTRALCDTLRERLHALPGIEILTPDDSHCGIVSFRVRGTEFGAVARHLAERQRIRVRMVGEAGLNAIRISTHIYNSRAELDRLVEGLSELAKG